MTNAEFNPEPRWKKPAKHAWKGLLFLRSKQASRSTAKAIRENKALTLSLAGTMAAAGIGAYGVVEARSAQHDLASVKAQLSALNTDVLLITAAVDQVRTNVRALDRKSAKALTALKHDMTATAIEMDNLAARVAALPPAPSLAPIAARISRVAAQAREAAREAAAATAAAAEQHDPEARAAAAQAAEAAGLAATAARAAQAKADAAAGQAEAAQLQAEAIRLTQETDVGALQRQIEDLVDAVDVAQAAVAEAQSTAELARAEAAAALARADLAAALAAAAQPFPRTISFGDIPTTGGAAPITKTFSVDLPEGSFVATATGHVENATDVWYLQLASAGRPAARDNKVGPGTAWSIMPFETGGGVQSFTITLDSLTAGSHSLTFADVKAVFEKVES